MSEETNKAATMPSSSAKKPAKKTEGKKGTATPARVLLEVLDKD